MCPAEDANGFLAATSERTDLNQYWFSSVTVAAFVTEVCETPGPAALVSSPSVYFSLPEDVRQRSKVLDFDRQWEADPGFVFYDFNEPENLPLELRGQFEFILIDPPFITKEVWEKYAATARFLARPGARLLCTTIAENQALLHDILGVWPALFRPSIPNLVYQYSTYVNYRSERLDQLNAEIDDEDWREALKKAEATACELDRPVVPLQNHELEAFEEASLEAPPSPEVLLLTDLRGHLAAVKRGLDGMQAPLQIAQRRHGAGGQAASAAVGKAETAIQAAESALLALDGWLHENEDKLPVNLLHEVAETTQEEPWGLADLRGLLAMAREHELLESSARLQEFAGNCRKTSSAIFKRSGKVLAIMKAIRDTATQP